MRSEEEVRQLLVLRTKEFNDYQVLKMRGDVTERLLRDLNWVLSDQKRKHCDTFEVLDAEAHEGEK